MSDFLDFFGLFLPLFFLFDFEIVFLLLFLFIGDFLFSGFLNENFNWELNELGVSLDKILDLLFLQVF